MRLFNVRSLPSYESGFSLVETVIVLFLLGTIAVIFLNGIAISSKAAFINDEQATAGSLARSQMEGVQNASYDPAGYSPAVLPSGKDYINYSANITTKPLHATEDGIQQITVIISHSGKQVFTLESYKVNR